MKDNANTEHTSVFAPGGAAVAGKTAAAGNAAVAESVVAAGSASLAAVVAETSGC